MANKFEIRNESAGVPIIGISRHRLSTDGHGVTTLVGFHGCNLRCKYCLNPEALGSDEGIERYSPEELYDKVKIDDLYFRATDGGITFGGGEPCLQADFIVRFRELCGDSWKIRVQTSLNAPYENFEKLVPVVDDWIVDIKTDDEDTYLRYTGQKFSIAYKNLRRLMSKLGYNSDRLTLRVPEIPGFVDKEKAMATKEMFEKSGILHIDQFSYITERLESESNSKTGKHKCELMKMIRRDLAKQFGIRMRERECDHEGDCQGTCQLCDHELECLAQQIKVIAPESIRLSDEVAANCGLKVNNTSGNSDIPVPETFESQSEEDTDTLGGQIVTPTVLQGFVQGPPPSVQYSQFEYRYKKILFKECAIAGLSFHLDHDDELWDELEVGTKLALVRDKSNKYDSNAVAVALADDYDGDPDDFDFDFILGYIPRACNSELAVMMDAGYAGKFSAEISTLKRYGNYNDRIHITIFVESSEPEIVRPDLLRAESLSLSGLRELMDELDRKGTAYFRFGGFPHHDLQYPEVGEKIVMIYPDGIDAILYLMRVIAKNDACAAYVDDPDTLHLVDDCLPFILTNVMGPVRIRLSEWPFLAGHDLKGLSATFYLEPKLTYGFRGIFKSQLYKTLNNKD